MSGDGDLLAEQIDFYRADAEPFDEFLSQLLDDENDEPVARTYRAGRARIARELEQRAPLGRVLEIAAGTGRLVELYAPHAASVVLLDASPESLAIARGRLSTTTDITFVEADILDWDDGDGFDTVVFSAWLHHVPHSRFESFWQKVGSLLAAGGRVIFDFPDAGIAPPGTAEIPDEPSEDYGFYAPVDGISVRDHFGRRWRVVHNLWDPDELASRLRHLGWSLTVLGPGLFGNIVWAEATRTHADRRHLGTVFNDVPELYDRVRPTYPDELFADLVEVAGIDPSSSVLEVGCGTGQATGSLAALGCSVTAVEPGAGMVELARRRVAGFTNVEIEQSPFETWDDRGRRFDLLVAASSWHWVDPAIGWPRAHEVLRPGAWMAVLGNVVVRRPGEPEVYAETADLHERFAPGNPEWGHPPLETTVRATDQGWGQVDDPGALFGPTIVRWYPTVQWFDGRGFADSLGSNSLYRALEPDVREPLLDAIAERIRTQMGDRAPRRYLSVLRIGQRAD